MEPTLLASASGRELTSYGLEADVRWCAAVDASTVVPVLRDGAFVDGRASREA
jgi:phosphosulfolactate phosphohydrolase-like enzyme